MSLYTVRITWERPASQTLAVEIPDGLTQSEVDELVEKALQKHAYYGMDVPEIEEWTFTGDEPKVKPPPEIWHEVGGHRWATDRAYLVRDDCDARRHPPVNWVQVDPADIWRVLTQGSGVPVAGRFSAEFADVLAAGTPRCVKLSNGTAAFVYRGDEVIAVVMERLDGPITIRP